MFIFQMDYFIAECINNNREIDWYLHVIEQLNEKLIVLQNSYERLIIMFKTIDTIHNKSTTT